MRTKWVSIGLVCLITFTGIIGFYNFKSDIVKAGILTVGKGPGNYSTIQDAINASVDGDTIFVFNGIYFENIIVNKSINLIGESSANTLIDGQEDTGVTITEDYVNISYFSIINSAPAMIGIHVNSDNNSILNNTIWNCGIGIRLVDSGSNNITNNEISSIALNGIELYDSLNNKIVNNQVSDNQGGIYLDHSYQNYIISNTATMADALNVGIMLYYSSNNTIENNTSNSNSWGGIKLDNSPFNIIKNNICNSNWRYGIEIQDGGDSIIDSNTLLNNADGIRLQSFSSGNLITNNTASGNSWDGIYLDTYTSNNNIINNNFTSNLEKGIYLEWSLNNNIINNNITNNDIGVYLETSVNNNIDSNIVSMNNESGIKLFNSPDNNITHNIISNNKDGIQIENPPGGNDIENNIISSNSRNGIYIHWYAYENNILANNISNNYMGINISEKCHNNSVIGNIILNNDYGILINDSIDNQIYHNNIINNTIQAIDDTNKSNQWDDGYPSGGNYWSDYIGFDFFSGPDQDILGSDGIGDDPYIIDSDSQDDYPLIQPVGFLFLYEGWNLISIPRIQLETNPGIILSSISGFYKTIQWYNTTDPDDPWKHNSTTKPQHLNDFDSIDHLIGFWIYITEPGGVLLEYYGAQPGAPQNIPLHTGWNMVGFPSFSNKNRTVGLNNLNFGVEVDAIFTFDAATQTWEEVGPGDDFQLGRGYWVHATQECVWEVPL